MNRAAVFLEGFPSFCPDGKSLLFDGDSMGRFLPSQTCTDCTEQAAVQPLTAPSPATGALDP